MSTQIVLSPAKSKQAAKLIISPVPPKARPTSARLKHVDAAALTVRRLRDGEDFVYHDADGRPIRQAETLERFAMLAIPPAYVDVRIAADPHFHLQAVGYDDAGRVQHRYHPEWERVRERRKLKRLKQLVEALPRLRQAYTRDLRDRALTRDKAVACGVALIDLCHIRVGNETYAKANGSHGASTLLKRHIAIAGTTIELAFRGKSGKAITCGTSSPALARALTRIMSLPGKRALQYRRDDRSVGEIHAADINAYLKRVTGLPISAKDLRMLAANAAAAELLLASEVAVSETGQKRQLADIMRVISERLVNTPAVVKKSYVHEIVVSSYASGKLKRCHAKSRARGGCSRIERTLHALAS
jgi:DNA topoisomerase-1